MARSTQSFGRHASDEALPYIPNWVTELRAGVSAVDSTLGDIPLAECINLRKIPDVSQGSRFGINTVFLLVKLTGASATITLYAREADGAGSDVHYKVASEAITESCLLKFENLPPLTFVPAVTVLAGGAEVEIAGGGTM